MATPKELLAASLEVLHRTERDGRDGALFVLLKSAGLKVHQDCSSNSMSQTLFE